MLLLFVISFLSYVLSSLPQTDVARQLLGEDAAPAAIAAQNHQLGLNRPVTVQYLDWLGQRCAVTSAPRGSAVRMCSRRSATGFPSP